MTTTQKPQTPTTIEGVDNFDERQPLLGASDGPHTISNDTDLDVRDKKRSWMSIGVLALLGAAILGLLVKLFLDGVDVDVCIPSISQNLSEEHICIV
jgi:hypothetical protein